MLVGIVKTICDLLLQGATGVFAIGQITALIASLLYVVIIKVLKLNVVEDTTKQSIIKLGITITLVTVIMTTCNYLFITPIYSGELFWFQMKDGSSLGYEGSYIMGTIITYIPFNFLKGLLITLVYYILFPRINSIIN